MKYKVIDVSQMLNGEDFARALRGQGSLFEIVGEDENPYLSKMTEPETEQKFKIGDRVHLAKEVIDFNCLDPRIGEMEYVVFGVEKVRDQFLYTVRRGREESSFFGYELERVR